MIPSQEPDWGLAPPEFRLPAETRLGAVSLQVSDLSRSIDYYRGVLRLRVYASTPDTAVLGPAGEEHPLLVLRGGAGVKPARRGALGLYHFAILLPDRAALGRFASHLSALGVRAGMADHLVSEALYLWDPDGLGIEVYADRPRRTWRHRNRELAMATDPLDVGSVMAAGGGQPWGAMPAGTRNGHVHLHVGSLEQAEGFYHHALGLDKMVWSYPGALFLAAGGYHHHLGTNVWSAAPAARADEARLLEWQLVVPDAGAVSAAAESLRGAGQAVDDAEDGWRAADPWGTRLRVVTRDPGGK